MTIASCVVTLTAVIVIYFTHVTSCSSSKISIYCGILEAMVTVIDLRHYSDWWLQFISACFKQRRGDWDLFPHILSCRAVLSTFHTKF